MPGIDGVEDGKDRKSKRQTNRYRLTYLQNSTDYQNAYHDGTKDTTGCFKCFLSAFYATILKDVSSTKDYYQGKDNVTKHTGYDCLIVEGGGGPVSTDNYKAGRLQYP